MSLVTQLQNLITRIGTEFKSVRTAQGDLASLSTSAKASLVAAINELVDDVANASSIDDASASTTKSYSSQKTVDLLAALKAEILGGASGAYDTLLEIEQLLEGGTSGLDALMTAIGKRVRFDQAETLTGTEKQTARDNIGAQAASDIGDTTTDFVTAFETAIA